MKSGPSWGRGCTWASDLVVSEQGTYGNRQTAALEPGSNGGRSDEVYVVYSYCTRHKPKVARECQFSGKRVWAMPWGYAGAAQLLGPYVAIPGSRQSDDVAARLCKWTDAVPRRGLGSMRESHRRSARAAAEGLVSDWDGDLFGSPRLVGAKQAPSPQSRLLGAPPLTTMRASRAFASSTVSADPESLVALGPIGRVQSSLTCRASPAKPNSGFSASAQACATIGPVHGARFLECAAQGQGYGSPRKETDATPEGGRGRMA